MAKAPKKSKKEISRTVITQWKNEEMPLTELQKKQFKEHFILDGDIIPYKRNLKLKN